MQTMHLTHDDGSEAPRAIHLVDIENLMGGTDFTAAEAARVQTEYGRVTGCSPVDHLVVASSHFSAPAAWFGWNCDRRLVQSGCDGADLALLDVIENENLANRYDRVVVGSGDGIFAEACAGVQRMGCGLTVVCRRRSSLSRRLELAVLDLRFLEHEDLGAARALQRAA